MVYINIYESVILMNVEDICSKKCFINNVLVETKYILKFLYKIKYR